MQNLRDYRLIVQLGSDGVRNRGGHAHDVLKHCTLDVVAFLHEVGKIAVGQIIAGKDAAGDLAACIHGACRKRDEFQIADLTEAF